MPEAMDFDGRRVLFSTPFLAKLKAQCLAPGLTTTAKELAGESQAHVAALRRCRYFFKVYCNSVCKLPLVVVV